MGAGPVGWEVEGLSGLQGDLRGVRCHVKVRARACGKSFLQGALNGARLGEEEEINRLEVDLRSSQVRVDPREEIERREGGGGEEEDRFRPLT